MIKSGPVEDVLGILVLVRHQMWSSTDLSFGIYSIVATELVVVISHPDPVKRASTPLLAIKDHIDWAWIDTCCIDKRSSAELSEAINSIFDWYKKSEVCYTYISDESILTQSLPSLFWKYRWEGRGWTLQELLAPSNVGFYDSQWEFLGTKRGLAPILSEVTRINVDYIAMIVPWSSACVAEKTSWASRRTTTRPEDEAYCLLGIFGINMPLLYGEGRFNAFQRLQMEILGSSRNDATIFGFNIRRDTTWCLPFDPPEWFPERFSFSSLWQSMSILSTIQILPRHIHPQNGRTSR
ncbi:HET-domain-containing protein [Xylariaceae sp. FL1272]|nr:HET-domain-containing protein [Xylariaceae sp. FL1272]